MRLRFCRVILIGNVFFCTIFVLLNFSLSNMVLRHQDWEEKSRFVNNSDANNLYSLKTINVLWKPATKLVTFLQKTMSTNTTIDTELDWRMLWPEGNQNSDRILEQINYIPRKLKNKTILIYLPHGRRRWNVRMGASVFRYNNCSVQNCKLSDSRSAAMEADAVIFRHRGYRTTTVRRREQIWILYSLESPHNTGSYKRFESEINWTATYRMDSDLVTPYEKIVPIAATGSFPINKMKRDFSIGKSKMVAWFVSNCKSDNNRMKYAKSLSKYINVDIYGTCGRNRCLDKTFGNILTCSQMLDKDYRFYLSFENSNCKHYVTEKFFVNGLKHDVIPIVMGASKEYYDIIAPPHSFIAVSDFDSSKDLAEYLIYLSNNGTAYNEYFEWKFSHEFINTKFWCRLCTLLNDPKQKVYNDLEEWWRNHEVCVKPKWMLDYFKLFQ